MALEYPHFLINFKIYEGTAGDTGLELARTIESIQTQTGASFAVAPQTPDLVRVARETSLSVVAQSVDTPHPGRGNGQISLPTVAKAGADGVILNHPESQDTLASIDDIVTHCADYTLESIVCVDSVEMGRSVLAFDPDCLLFEQPTDIATERSIARSNPEHVETFVAMVNDLNPRTRILLGGGISTATDVEQALALGADAAGAASAFVDATDRRRWLSDIASALLDRQTD